MDATSSRAASGQNPYSFTLILKYDGRIDLSVPIRYLGGKNSVNKIDPDEDEWGFITLQEKFMDLGYKKEDFRFFSVREGALVELLTDLDALNLIQSRPKEVEVWVIPKVIAEETIEEDYGVDCLKDVEELLSFDFGDFIAVEYDKFTDVHVEYGGNDVVTSAKGVGVDDKGQDYVFDVNEEINLSDDREIVSTDEEVDINVWDSIKPPIKDTPPTLWLGRTFKNKLYFKEAVEEYAVTNGKELRFLKNDNDRYIAICTQDGCKWKVILKIDKDELCWRITTFNDIHHPDCPWVKENKFITAALVAKRWKAELGRNSEWKMEEFRQTACTTDRYQISKRQAYKAMTLAKNRVEGEAEVHFGRIWSYIAEIKNKNPNTTVRVKLWNLDCEGDQQRLLRVYICWDACKEGFKFCRPIIGVDGCHLRSKYGGMLLTAVGMDANESLFPIAYAIVEGESRDSWNWFLELLKRDLMITPIGEPNFTFMSDKQKGLIPAFEDVFPRVSHRFCVRHLQGNLKLAGFTGTPIKDALWKAARATTANTFTAAMNELRDLDVDAFQWLSDKLPSEWSRSHFTTSANSDILVNNICESFNAMILDARKVPLINCLEMLRKQIMVRLFKCRQQAANWSGKICPVIMGKLSLNEKHAGGYWAYQSNEHLIELSGAHDQHQVDLRSRTCSCRKWQLTGIPCRHAIAAIWMKKGKVPVVDFVDHCYSVESYLNSYGGSIHPIVGPEEWPITDRAPPLPPLNKAKVGRPRKLRKKSAPELTKDGVHVSRKNAPELTKDGVQVSNQNAPELIKDGVQVSNQNEPELTKDGVHVSKKNFKSHCGICKQTGHNRRRCPQNPNRQTRPQRRDRPPVRQPTIERAEEITQPANMVVDENIPTVCLEVAVTQPKPKGMHITTSGRKVYFGNPPTKTKDHVAID